MKMLLVPGSGAGGNFWHYQIRYFPDCEGISLPGHPKGKPFDSMAAYVDWLHDYIQAKSYRDVVLGGHSLGGGIALLYALTYPTELKGLVLIGTGARLRVRPDILSWLEGMIDNNKAWREWIMRGPFSEDPALQPVRQLMGKIGPAVMLSDFLCCDKFDVMERLGEIRVPTLIIVSTEDVMTPVKYAQYMNDRIAGSALVIIDGASHSVAIENPDEINQAIAEWRMETFTQNPTLFQV